MHDGPAALQAGDEIRLLIEPGGCFEVPGSADSVAMRQQLAAALAASVLLEGGLVLITDWLPGLQWRIQVSQRFADLLPGLTVDAIWSAVEPHLARWLERPADADVFVVSPKWGECALVPSAYRCGWEFVAFTFRCHWSTSLATKQQNAQPPTGHDEPSAHRADDAEAGSPGA